MKRAVMFLLHLCILVVPALALAQPPEDPGDIGQNFETLIDAIRTGKAIAIAAAAISLVVSLFKSPFFGGVVSRVPVRWRIALPIVLGGIAGMLYDIMAAVPSHEAMLVGLLSGPAAVFGHELVAESLLGGTRTRHPSLAQKTP